MSLILLNDNSNEEKSLSALECKNLGEIAGKTIGELKILVFPPMAEKTDDKIADSVIFYMSESGGKVVLETGNIMGFVGCGGTEVNICSRFTENGKGDFFLHYMLEKVCHINIAKLESSRVRDRIFDFLPFLFPEYLIDALGQGLYKEYQTHEYNDSNVRGVIDINRHIRLNVPANGKIPYRAREYSYDNPVMQLVRHTIEYMRANGLFKYILSSSEKMKEAVAVIDSATPSYNRMERNKILSKTAKAIKSPYFFKYRSLQKICRMILLREKIKYDSSADKIYGILFDGAWLWEEYLATVLKGVGYVHPENKLQKGGFSPFENAGVGRFFPDFYKPKDGAGAVKHLADEILDAKYKRFDAYKPPADDLAQMIAYIHVMDARSGFFVYPSQNEGGTDGQKKNDPVWTLKPFANQKAKIGTKAVFIPQNAENYQDFKAQMKSEEERLVERLMGIL
ncbi:MAG: McrC family protein [Treponema sp.]